MILDCFKGQDDFYKGLQILFASFNIPVNLIDAKPLNPKDILPNTFKDTNPAYQLMDDVYILGMVDDKAFSNTDSEDISEIQRQGKNYDGILIFGVTLKEREISRLPTRTQLAEITRALNREFPYTPVVVAFRYANFISLANTERQKYKQERHEGEKAVKVSILRDVDIENPHPGHLKILEELKITRSGKNGIHSFEGFYKYWPKAFNVNLLNKNFYTDLSNWYFWAINHVTFPAEPTIQSLFEETGSSDFSQLEAAKQEFKAKHVIRLLTRLLFVWFLKEKNLIPEDLFDLKALQKNILKKISPFHEKDSLFKKNNQESIYYKAILQNLFFATLNCPVKPDNIDARERGFRGEESYGKHRGVDYLMRYKKYFKNPNAFLEMVNDVVPFLNGGLFECLDDKDKKIYIDGFSDNMSKTNGVVNQLIVPDNLFFGSDEKTDLSADYGKKNKGTREAAVKGLINILKSYKFTITENTPIEEDVALDPELLGKVFENLLASYNPETKNTARKQTGSFYTPREIVNYMVDESLISHLKNAVSNWDMENEELDQKLHQLVSFDPVNPFVNDARLSREIIHSLDNCKILDPACGSGAFPMGILQKMVHILKKIDPGNEYWHDLQLKKAQKATEGVFVIKDKAERRFLLDEIKNAFDQSINNPDYARKLFLIENCIYGVDIQPIATQISKLRLFISLIVEQKVNKEKKNFRIRPLPNLETKFVTANTLIGIDKPDGELFFNREIQEKKVELKAIRHKLLSAKSRATKVKYRKKDEEFRNEIANILKYGNLPVESAELLAGWDPYDQNWASPFFDPEWMFDIRDGFDLVIGNPPYVDSETMVHEYSILREELRKIYKSAKGNWDLFVVFIEQGINLTKKLGVTTYIVPNKFISAKYTTALRNFISSFQIQEIADYSSVNVFEESDVYPSVFRIIKTNEKSRVSTKLMKDLRKARIISSIKPKIFYSDIFWDKYFFNSNIVNAILEISKHDSLGMHDFTILGAATVSEAYQIKEKMNDLSTPLTSEYYKLINTGTIDPFKVIWGEKQTKYIKNSYAKPVISKSALSEISQKRVHQSDSAKLIVAGMTLKLESYFDRGGILAGKSTSIILGKDAELGALNVILNSELLSFWFSKNYNSLSMAGGYFNVGPKQLSSLPIPKQIFENHTELLSNLNCIIETSLFNINIFSELVKVMNAVVFELYFPDHMKEGNIDVLPFVKHDIEEAMHNKEFESLSNPRKEHVITELYARWSDPDSEIVKRMNSFSEKSPEILKPILEG